MSYRTHNDVCGNFFIAFLQGKETNMKMELQREHTGKLTVCAMMVALATILSTIKLDVIFGGGVTLFSMVPILALGVLFGLRWGFGAAFVYSILQLLLGLDNVMYLQNFWSNTSVALVDYILPYTALGVAGFFRLSREEGRGSASTKLSIAVALGCTLRFLCHWFSGMVVWNDLTSTEVSTFEFPWGSVWDNLGVIAYSAVYNGWYMIIELVLTMMAMLLLYPVLKRLRDKIEH